MTRAACLAALAACILGLPLRAQQAPAQQAPAQQAPARDTLQRVAPGGSATITGSVIEDVDLVVPLRRARVTATGPELPDGRTVITRDDGSFTIDRLPAGRYVVRAEKGGYVPMAAGARRPNSQAASIAIRAGDTRRVTIRLPRGAVVAGLVGDRQGRPIPGVAVTALSWRYVASAGERRLVASGTSASITDDRGEYRIYGLPAGDYALAATVRGTQSAGELQVVSDADIRRAVSDLGQFSSPRSRPGLAPPPPPAGAATPATARRAVAFAPVFFPGTADMASAATVKVGRAEERGGVDITLDYVPTASISGFAVLPPEAGDRTTVLLARADRTLAGDSVRAARASPTQGAFSFGAVTPGRYTVLAFAGSGGFTAAPGAWAAADVVVDGEDVVGLFLVPQRPIAVEGRVRFEGATAPPRDLSGFRVTLPAVRLVANAPIPLPAAALDREGRFTLTMVPGDYRLASPIPGTRSPIGPWFLASVSMNGREILDAPPEFQQSASDLVVTFSDRATELSGRVFAAGGDADGNAYVIVFSTNRDTWFPNSRRIAAVRPRDDGTFAIRNLPPGDYFAVAVADLEDGEWNDPVALEQLSIGAVHLALGAAERKTQDLRLRQVFPF